MTSIWLLHVGEIGYHQGNSREDRPINTRIFAATPHFAAFFVEKHTPQEVS